MKLVFNQLVNEFPYHVILKDEKGNKYFFKATSKDETFRELLAQEITSILGLNHVTYTPYDFEGISGVYSPYFMSDEYEYISGEDLVSNYIDDTISNNVELLYNRTEYNGKIGIKKEQDLYIIWQAMEKRFKHCPNYEEQIKKFMDSIINIMLFDLLTVDPDRHGENWYIEYDDTSFRLCPIFDNDFAFKDSFNSQLNTTQDLITNGKALELLLNESDDLVYDKFTDFTKFINPDSISDIIEKTIKKYKFPINKELKRTIIDRFTINYSVLETVVNSYKQRELVDSTSK